MKITFRTVSGEQFTLDAESAHTVGELKGRVVAERGLAADTLKLLYKGKALDKEGASLAEAGVSEEGFIVVFAPKAKPAAPAEAPKPAPAAGAAAAQPAPGAAGTSAPAAVSARPAWPRTRWRSTMQRVRSHASPRALPWCCGPVCTRACVRACMHVRMHAPC